MNERVETVIDGLTDHFSSGDKLGIKSVENVFEVLAFSGLLWVKELQKFLDERGSDVHLEGLDVSAVVHDKLQEKFVDWLQVGPGWVDQKLLLKFKIG